jgi:hypothetical protein
MKDQTSMKTENDKIIAEGQMPPRRGGLLLSDVVFGLFGAFLLINSTITCPEATIPAAIIVAVGWSIVMTIRMWPNSIIHSKPVCAIGSS